MTFMTLEELEKGINELKRNLEQVVQATGINSHDTLHCSQKLDQLILKYQNECSILHKNINKV